MLLDKSMSEPQQPAEEGRQSDKHRKSIVIEVTRLQVPQHPGKPPYRVGRAIHQHAVDNDFIALVP